MRRSKEGHCRLQEWHSKCKGPGVRTNLVCLRTRTLAPSPSRSLAPSPSAWWGLWDG